MQLKLRLLLTTISVIVFSFVTTLAQNTGDYRTISNGHWKSVGTTGIWEVYNGSSWEVPTTYPGETSIAGNVQISHSVTLTSSNGYITISSLTVGGASTGNLLIGDNTGTGLLSVSGNIAINSGASLVMSSDNIYFDNIIILSGNWINNGTFNAGKGTIVFNGGASQSIYGNTTFYRLTNAGNNLTLNSPIAAKKLILNNGILAGSGLNTSVTILNSGTVEGNGGTYASDPFFHTNLNDGCVVSGNIVFPRVQVNGSVDFGPNSTIKYYLFIYSTSNVVNNAPSYMTGSSLMYIGSNVARGLEWSSPSGKGCPVNVAIQYNTTVNLGNSVAVCTGGLFIQQGSTLNMGANPNPLTVGSYRCDGVMNMSTSSSSDLYVTGGNYSGFQISPSGIFNSNGRKVYLTGTSEYGGWEAIQNTNPNNIIDLIIDKPRGYVNSNFVLYLNTLTFSSTNVSNIATSTKVVITNPDPNAVSRIGEGYVFGNVERAIKNGINTSYLFPVGDPTVHGGDQHKYASVTITFNEVTTGGYLTANTTTGEHPNINTSTINSSKSVNRIWTITKDNNLTSSSYALNLAYSAADNDNVNAAPNYILGKYDGSTWSHPTISGTPTSSFISATGLTGFGSFAVGQKNCSQPTTASIGSNSPICAGSSLNLTSSVSGTAPFSYSWSGPNGFNSTDQNPAINNTTTSTSGLYNVTISNACGSIQASTSVTVNAATTYYLDSDGDTYGDASVSTQACSAPARYVSDNTDCDDNKASVHPGATEVCNGIDDDCDGDIDEGVKTTFYADADGDGFGDNSNTTQACSAPQGYVSDNTDCDDSKASVHPGATEVCNGIDDDCDGEIDEGVKTIYYADTDGDGYGDNSKIMQACSTPQSYVSNNTDCDDTKFSVHPGAVEICGNGIDDNCNGTIDEGCVPVTVVISDASVREGNRGQVTIKFDVVLSRASSQTVTVQYGTQNGNATAGSDYVAKSGTVTFAPGTKRQTISITVNGDKTPEANETFTVQLSSANAQITDASGIGTIINDDGTATITSARPANTVTEEEGSISVKVSPNPVSNVFQVQLSGYTGKVTVQFLNIYGAVLKQEKLQTPGNGLQINVKDVASGVYFLSVMDDKGKRQTERVIVAR